MKNKSSMISTWKQRGLIYDDYSALYDRYILTTNCEWCKKEFKSSKDRCLDHNHETGEFRKIVCHKCNTHDCYLKYPDGFTREDSNKYQREYIHKQKPAICYCCRLIMRCDSRWKHRKGKPHLKNVMRKAFLYWCKVYVC
tara:strand:+ start:1385 stop:1804 length:420 start_codon:yes stop_codon:yes gene_type:complete